MAAGDFHPRVSFSFPYDLRQNFDILNNFMAGNSYSLVSVNLGHSTNPDVERAILDVASYGKQLGRIGDALSVLIEHFRPERELTEKEKTTIFALKSLLFEIGQAKDAALEKAG